MLTLIQIVFTVLIFLQKGTAQDFSYTGNLGPSHWSEKFSSCVGKHQSPIDISEQNVKEVKLWPLVFKNFDETPDSATLTNNGHTVLLQITAPLMPEISGGPLKGSYRFEQLHFHWGENDQVGSENTINNSSFPMELHIVFYKTSYRNFSEATQHADGLTVLAFLFKVAAENNTNYDSILTVLHEVKEPNTSVSIHKPIHLNALLMDNRIQYFTYDGSLTTPPCSEIVTWIEFKHPIPLAHVQLEFFRKLKMQGKITHNFRPTQPIYDRIIHYNVGNEIDLGNDLDDKQRSGTTRIQSYSTILIFMCYIINRINLI